MHNRIVVILGILILIDLYFFQAFTNLFPGLPGTLGYWLPDAIVYGAIVSVGFTGNLSARSEKRITAIFSLLVLTFVPKLSASLILLLEDIFRLGHGIFSLILTGQNDAGLGTASVFLSRSRLVSQVTVGVSVVMFGAILYGMIRGKYNYRVRRITLAFDDLPDAFNGFRITQLSDIHSGSLKNRKAVQKGIDLANRQNSDVILFTGDLINNRAEEMEPWIDVFSKLEAPRGKFSVLGNHDYGDYIYWRSDNEKAQNLQRLKEIHSEIGFRLLLDEHVTIEKDGQRLNLIGIENWGRGFSRYGNLNKAMESVDPGSFKILLSHDPSHWTAQTIIHPLHVHLTLAGHTHGMQFGVELANFKWSPVKYLYPQWAGIYSNNGQYLYVNRGFGFLGFSGRVGIQPEITVITLRKKQ